MTPNQAVDALLSRHYRDNARARIVPLYDHDSLADVRRRLHSVPPNIDDLLSRGAGIQIGYSEVRWDGNLAGAQTDALPVSIPVMEDGLGNFWMVDVDPIKCLWREIYYVSHDPPVIVHQASNFSGFLLQFGDECASENGGLITRVHEGAAREIWAGRGSCQSSKRLSGSPDPLIRQLVEQFGDDSWICDLRSAQPGQGFAWAEGREALTIHRPASEPVFVLVR
jgi:hypothetical protein